VLHAARDAHGLCRALMGLLRSPIERSTAHAADHPTGTGPAADHVPRASTFDRGTFIESLTICLGYRARGQRGFVQPDGGSHVMQWAIGSHARCAVRHVPVAR